MKAAQHIQVIVLLAWSANSYSQVVKLDQASLEPVNVTMSFEKMDGKDVVRVRRDPKVSPDVEPTIVRIKGSELKNGTIEVSLLSRLLPDAPPAARGFIGLAFRINGDNSKFESFYVRPTNGRADDQVRRNHSTQYFSHPDYTFDRLRKEAPEKYESYADMGLNEWIKMKIEVKGGTAKLSINNSKQPVLIVNDLKLGDNSTGAVGLQLGNGTEAFFADLKITAN